MVQDIKYLQRWITGEDKFLMRRDNDNLGFLSLPTMAQYRFHFNYEDVSALFHKIFIDVSGQDDPLLHEIMKWQKFLTLFPGKQNTTAVSYNYDDVAKKKSETYYLSNFTLNFDTLDRNNIIQKFRRRESLHFIPDIIFDDVVPEIQKPLNLTRQEHAQI